MYGAVNPSQLSCVIVPVPVSALLYGTEFYFFLSELHFPLVFPLYLAFVSLDKVLLCCSDYHRAAECC
jgi:hypothetical protein